MKLGTVLTLTIQHFVRLFVCNTVTAKRIDGFKVLMKLIMHILCTKAKLRIVKDFNIYSPIDSSVSIYLI